MDLIKIEEKNVKEIFTVEGIEGLIDQVRLSVKDFKPDLSTVKSRKEIASVAYKVAQSKTYVEGFGKKLSTALKTDAKAVDAARKYCRDTLDGIKNDIRQPLNEWEAEEESRVLAHQTAIEDMKDMANLLNVDGCIYGFGTLKHTLATLETVQLGKKHWDEFADEAAKVKAECISILKKGIKTQEKFEAEQAELERLRKKKEENDRKEYERRIAKKAAEQAKKEAEEKAAFLAERKEIEIRREKRRAEEAIERAEREKIEAIEEAKRKAKQKEIERLEKENAEKAEAERIASDKKHREKIEMEIIEDFEMAGFETIYAKGLIELINTNAIRHMVIQY